MAVVTVGTIFDAISQFEGAAEAYFADLRDRTKDDGVRLVTHYLARRKQRLPHVLSMAVESELKTARDFPVLVADHQIPGPEFFSEHLLADSATGDDLLVKAILFRSCCSACTTGWSTRCRPAFRTAYSARSR